MTFLKKALSLTMVFLLVFSCLPMSAFADEVETETKYVIAESELETGSVSEETDSFEESKEVIPTEEKLEDKEQESEDETELPEDKQGQVPEAEEETEESSAEETVKEELPAEDPSDAETNDEETIPEAEETDEISGAEEKTLEKKETEIDDESVADAETEPDEKKTDKNPEGAEPVPCTVTVALMDVRDNILFRRNGEIIASVFGNYTPGSGSYYLVGPTKLEAISPGADGMTRLVFAAMTDDLFTIEVGEPVYGKIGYAANAEINVSSGNGVSVCSVKLKCDTEITVNGDYSAAKGYFLVGGSRSLRATKAGDWTPPDAMYVSLGSCYSDYSSTAIVNGHTGVYFFQPEDMGEGHFVSATCGSTTKHMVSGVHYRVARIAETAARAYLDYGSGCCSQRAQRALAWITYHGQSEYDWRRYNNNEYLMGDGTIYVANQLEAYTINFLAAWVCTNDGRVGSYGTVHAEDGAHALDFMFGSSFSTGLPASTKNAIDQMVSMGLAFADAHPNPDENVLEYQRTWIYSDGYADHQPLLVGAYQGENSGSVSITKKSSVPQYTNGNAMYSFEGTTFQIKDSDGNVAGTLVADASGKTPSLELTAGTYTVSETKVGKGFIRDTSTKKVTIAAGEEAKVTFTNDPIADPGSIYLRKWDSETDRPIPQGSASLKGAQYRFDYYDNTNWSGSPKASWVFETDANGIIRYAPEYKVSGADLYNYKGAYVFPLGSIKISEVKAPTGYRMSTDSLYATITQSGSTAKLTWTAETQSLIKAYGEGWAVLEDVIRGGVRFKKVDRETGDPVSGAEITIYSNSDEEVLVDGSLYAKDDAIITLITGDDGTCQTSSDYLPYGSYYALETKASEGYLLNEEWRVDFSIRTNGQVVDCTTGDSTLKEQIIRGDLSMLKLDIDGNYKPNIPFMIVQIGEDGEEGEWHVIVTDENGMIDTSAASRPHTNKTNSLDQYVDGGVFTDTSKLDPTVGVWFGDSQPDDSLGALPYGRYKVYELQTEQLAAEQINILESPVIEITVPDKTVILTPMVNLNIDLKSEALSADGQAFIPAAAVRVVDTVHYTNLTSHRRYTMETQFVLKSTAEVLATVSKDFYPPDGPSGTSTAKGSVSLEAEIDVSDYPGDYVVACDYLYEYVKGTKILIASHADMEDKAQTLRIPSIRTMARDTETNDNVGIVSENAEIIDTVWYTNLKRGEVFKLVSKLVDYESGEYIKGPDGEDLVVEQGFVCWLETDSVEMPAFKIDSNEYQGKSVVVVEELYWVNEDHDFEEVLMASHTSLDDKDQTITYPEIHTSATDENTENHVGVVSEETAILDEVILSGLIPGKEYTVSGVLVYQEEFVDEHNKLHKAGDPVPIKETSENKVTFTADAAEMIVTLTYVVDSGELNGRTVVVFEDLLHNDVKVASHADLTDKEQSVLFPDIHTNAIDKTSDSCFVTRGTEVFFVDTVSYSNLVVGENYVIRGRLMDKESGHELGYTAQSAPFKAYFSDGMAAVEFAVNTEELGSGIIVVFEDLYLIKEDGTEVLTVKHENLNDEDQSLYCPEIRTTAVNAETGTHEAQGKTMTVLSDTVSYSNLKPGTEYKLIGVLLDKETGVPIVIDGERITSKAAFTPTEKNGKITLFFEFDGLLLVGKTVVVFESLYYEGIEIAVHADIEDEAQSVNIIDIRTSVKDKDTGTHTATLTHNATFVDTVSYEGLTPGKTYTVYGKIMMKSTGEVLQQKGIPVTGITEFVPKTPNGTIEVIFLLDTFMVEGKDLVVFEDLFAGSVTDDDLKSKVPIASHADLEDKDQTISVPKSPNPPVNTGVNMHAKMYMAVMLVSGMILIWLKKAQEISAVGRRRLSFSPSNYGRMALVIGKIISKKGRGKEA